VGIEEELDEQAFNRRCVVADLVVAGGFGAAQFQPVQRGFTRQWRAVRSLRSQLASKHRQHRIIAQFVVVVQILIAQSNADDALHHQGFDLVLDQPGGAGISEAGRKPFSQPDRPISLAQQQRISVRGDCAAVETGDHRAAFYRWKFE